MNNVVHSTLLAFLALCQSRSFTLLSIQMCCQKLLYALTLVVWVDSTPVGSQGRSHRLY